MTLGVSWKIISDQKDELLVYFKLKEERRPKKKIKLSFLLILRKRKIENIFRNMKVNKLPCLFFHISLRFCWNRPDMSTVREWLRSLNNDWTSKDVLETQL